MEILQVVLQVLLGLTSILLTLLILLHKGRGGGLASAFGGAGANTAFGSKTGDVLTWATSVVFGVFLILAVALNLMAEQIARPAPPAPAVVTPPPPPVPGAVTPPATSKGVLGTETGASTPPPVVPVETPTLPAAPEPQTQPQ